MLCQSILARASAPRTLFNIHSFTVRDDRRSRTGRRHHRLSDRINGDGFPRSTPSARFTSQATSRSTRGDLAGLAVLARSPPGRILRGSRRAPCRTSRSVGQSGQSSERSSASSSRSHDWIRERNRRGVAPMALSPTRMPRRREMRGRHRQTITRLRSRPSARRPRRVRQRPVLRPRPHAPPNTIRVLRLKKASTNYQLAPPKPGLIDSNVQGTLDSHPANDVYTDPPGCQGSELMRPSIPDLPYSTTRDRLHVEAEGDSGSA